MKKWINDGNVSKKIPLDSPIPEGWKRGLHHRVKPNPNKNGLGPQNTIWITDGIQFIRHSIKLDIPEGFIRGNPNSNLIWITNGTENKRILPTEEIPSGWRLGRHVTWQSSQYHYTEEQWNVINNISLYHQKYHIEQKLPLDTISTMFGFGHGVFGSYTRAAGLPTNEYRVTYPHLKICQILDELGIEYQNNTRKIIPPQELDIFIPAKNIAIEVNGLYHHKDHDKKYHLDKTLICEKKNINLIHLWDIEIINKFDIVKSIITHRCGAQTNKIYARKTQIQRVPNKNVEKFLEDNHIQGTAHGSACYALFLNQEMVSVMSFSIARLSRKWDWELVRFANHRNLNVIGAANKLFMAFIRDHKPQSVVTYSDTRLFTGNVYKSMGFTLSHKTAPQYWYFKTQSQDKLYNRMHFQKKMLQHKLTTFDPSKTEHQNMLENGWSWVWDCGHKVWSWTSKDIINNSPTILNN